MRKGSDGKVPAAARSMSIRLMFRSPCGRAVASGRGVAARGRGREFRTLVERRARRWRGPPGPITSVPIGMRSRQRWSIIGWLAAASELIRAILPWANRRCGSSSMSWTPGEKRAKASSKAIFQVQALAPARKLTTMAIGLPARRSVSMRTPPSAARRTTTSRANAADRRARQDRRPAPALPTGGLEREEFLEGCASQHRAPRPIRRRPDRDRPGAASGGRTPCAGGSAGTPGDRRARSSRKSAARSCAPMIATVRPASSAAPVSALVTGESSSRSGKIRRACGPGDARRRRDEVATRHQRHSERAVVVAPDAQRRRDPAEPASRSRA